MMPDILWREKSVITNINFERIIIVENSDESIISGDPGLSIVLLKCYIAFRM